MFKLTSQALILGRSKDEDLTTVEISLGADRSYGATETIVIPLPPSWSGVKARCADVLRLVVAATGFEPTNLAILRDDSSLLPMDELIAPKRSYRVTRLETYASAKKSPFFHCAVVAFQALPSGLFLSSNTSASRLSVSRFNLRSPLNFCK
jgi:hypothetical protein